MGGKASLIMVIGFAIIFGYINLNLAKITSRGVENMVGYYQVSMSRNLANAGANVGLSMLTADTTLRGTLVAQNFTSGPYNGCSYRVTFDQVNTQYLRLRSASTYSTGLKTVTGSDLVLADTVQVTFQALRKNSFSYIAWLTNTENGVNFIEGDTIDGRVHSNGNININGGPVFKQKVTTSGKFVPNISTRRNRTDNKGEFLQSYETGVAKKPFPTDIGDVITYANNKVSTKTQELWVEFKAGTTADNDGYVIISTGNFLGSGGTKQDSMKLSNYAGNAAVYSTQNVHVKGTLDGRLSLGSGNNIIIEGNTKYEVSPLVDPHTTDMLGLITNDDIIISSTITFPGVTINGCLFSKDGSFTAQNWSNRGDDGTIHLIGSIAQNVRGAVGNFSSSTGVKMNGFYKDYKFDPRLDDPNQAPPYFPGWYERNFKVVNWWESYHKPEFF